MADIGFDIIGGAGWITLDRPQALNALTYEQFKALSPQLTAWAGDPLVRAVVIRATGGKAFCAGGDIRSVHEAQARGDFAFIDDFYGLEYRTNRQIKAYPKPFIALMDGIVMGGGAGVSVHGSHRVVTERTVFAMPEVGIGLFPDIGATWFLPRLPGRLGLYMALTGARLSPADCLYAGLSTHYMPSVRLPELSRALQAIDVDHDAAGAISCVLDMYAEEPGASAVEDLRDSIDRCFSAASVEGVLAALTAEGGDWAERTAAEMAKKSPTSLKVTFRQMQAGAVLDFDRAMVLEYRLARRFVRGHDLFEGIRAVIIDKDQSPRWMPAELAAVDAASVDGYFRPLDGAADLTFEGTP